MFLGFNSLLSQQAAGNLTQERLYSWKRADFIEKGGWDKMPGQEKAGCLVSRACADGLGLLFEK
jgi:hypothetical protein